jgi:nucleotide-binding universal stress UspA family protein
MVFLRGLLVINKINMKHISPKKILIPVDFSPTSHKAFHHAKTLAKQFGSEVILMHVLEDWPFSGVFPFLPNDDAQLRDSYQARSMAQLEKLREELYEAGVKNVELQYSEGNMALCVSDVAKDMNVDLVAMGTHGSKRAPGFLMGSNAYKIVSLLNIPALTVHEKAAFGPYQSIVTTIDDSPSSRAKFVYVAQLAKAFNSNVEILYPKVEDSERVNMINQYFNQVSEYLEKEKVVHASKEIEGHFAHEVIKFAEYTNADLIVIMSDTESSISSMLLGSNAHEIITHSTTPVITLHPEERGEYWGMYF